MNFFRKSIISNQVIKSKSDKLLKKILRDAGKKIRKGELIDSHSLALYLPTIDERYSHLQSDIDNATRVHDYSNVRAQKIAETRQLITFFNQDYAQLNHLSELVAKRAEEAGRTDDFRHEKMSSVDLTKLKENLDLLVNKEQ